jgi:hypothetical protein
MSLPLQAVDRLFDRLSATYGRQFMNLYDGMDANAIKAVWAHELSGFGMRLNSIAWALENLPERAPNAIEFRNICRKAPEPERPKLQEPPADPARLKAELAKLMPAIQAARAVAQSDNLAWARRIMGRCDGGEKIAPAVVRMARDALARKGVAA